MGYDPEVSNFVLEVTYRYGETPPGNVDDGLAWVKIKSRAVYNALADQRTGSHDVDMREVEVASPGQPSYVFHVIGEDPDPDVGPIASVCININGSEAHLPAVLTLWVDALGLLEIDRGEDFITLSAGSSSPTIRLRLLPAGQCVKRGSSLSLACSTEELSSAHEALRAAGFRVEISPSDDAPRASVMEDPDGHRINLLVEDVFNAAVHNPDDTAPQRLNESIAKDSKMDWFKPTH